MDVTLLIIDDDGPEPGLAFATAASTVDEASGLQQLVVQLDGYAPDPVSVQVGLGGTATPGADFDLLTPTVTIPVGSLSGLVEVDVIDDPDPEPSEQAELVLTSATGATVRTPDVHVLTITDDDTVSTVSFALPASSAGEAAGLASIQVDLDVAATGDVTIPLVLSGSATAGGVDVEVTPNPLVIPAGATTGQFDVTILDDTLHEAEEELVLTFGAITGADPGAVVEHVLTLSDDDPMPVVEFAAFRTVVNELDGSFDVRIELDTASGLDVVAPFQVSGDAAGPGDITAPTSPAVIPAGQTFVDVNVPMVVDRVPELAERVVFTLLDGGAPGTGAPEGATLGAGTTFLVLIADGDRGAVAVAPPLTPSVTALPFAQARQGEASAAQTVFFTNLHSDPVTLSSLSLVGEGAGSFTVAAQSGLPVVLAPAASVGVDVTFGPTQAGEAVATLTALQVGQGAPPIEVSLSGRALGPTGADLLFTADDDPYTEPGGQLWIPEYNVNRGQRASVETEVGGTDLDELFQSVRIGLLFDYALPVPNGTYEVTLFSWEPVKNAPGERVFDMTVEGALVLDDLDLFVEVGRDMAYESAPFTAVVTDGVLDIGFDASVSQALVSAISVRSVPVLSSPTTELAFGIVDQGTTTSLAFEVQNDGLHPGVIDRITFGEPTLGSAVDFSIQYGGITYVGDTAERVYTVDPPISVGPGLNAIDVTFAPTEHEDHTFTLDLESVDAGLLFSADVAGTGGAEAGWGFLHPVPDSTPEYVVDYDGDGVEEVRLFGEESHTHEPGRQLATFTWRLNGAVIASTPETVQSLPLGASTVELEIGDDNATPNFAADDRTITVYSADAVVGALVQIYDGSTLGEVFLLDNVPAAPDFVQRLEGMSLAASNGTIGGSSYSQQAMVRWEAAFDLTATRTLDFSATGGVDRRLLVDGAPVTGPLTLGAGTHTVEARFAVTALSDMPVEVSVLEGGSVPSDIAGLLVHDETTLPPVIHSMPSVGTDLGGNRIDIQGFGFFPSSQVVVHWGTQDFTLADFIEFESEHIVFNSPPGTGSIQVTVETPNGVSSAFPFSYSPTGPIPIRFDLLESAAASITDATSGTWGPDGKFYVCGLDGSIHVITYDGDYGVVSNEFKVGISTLTNRDSLGVAFNPYDIYDPQDPTSLKLYIAHGEHFQNGGGAFTGPSDFTGQVTLLTGPDFDNPVPVVTGLPLSNHDHGLNGLLFDDNGDLLLCTGSNTNAGIKWPLSGDVPESPLSASLVRICLSRSNFNGTVEYEDSVTGALVADQVLGEQIDVVAGVDVEVYAPGLRNSLDIVLHTNGYLYATDNGPNNNYGPASLDMTTEGGYPHPSTPDTLDLVEPGRYYGNPNRARGRYDERQGTFYSNYTGSIPHVHAGPMTLLNASTNGIDEYRATAFNSGMRGDLIAMKWNSGVWQIVLKDSGREVQTKTLHASPTAPFTRNRGLDVATGPGGAILSVDYTGNKVRVQVPDDAAALGLTPYDILPWRSPAGGGQRFVIGGQNFGTDLSATSVFIGGVAATLSSVSDTRIVGVLPPSSTGLATALLDVEVRVGFDTRTIPEAFRYMPPTPGMKLGAWRDAEPLPVGLEEAAGAEVGGVIYAFGAGSGQSVALDVLQTSYATGRAPRPFAGGGHVAVAQGDKVYLFGGFDASAAGQVQIYDPTADSWSTGSAMPWNAGGCVAAEVDGMIYVGGGVAPGGGTVSNFASYDPQADSWTALAALPTGVHLASGGSDGQRVFVLGGRTGALGAQAGVDEVQVYDPVSGTWETSSAGQRTALPTATAAAGAAIHWDGELYVFGGSDGTAALDAVQVYDVAADTWRADCPLPTGRQGAAIAIFESRTFLLGGSDGASGAPLSSGEVFSPR